MYQFQENANVEQRLNGFLKMRKIPNIIFHGSAGTGKKTIVYQFIHRIYGENRAKIKNNVMYVNCAHGKGIKFIREDLKYFAKTNIQSDNLVQFKSIVLFNADELTTDAQSALRRCIEVFSYNTRFFIIVENKYKLLNPILSRFCEIYIPDKSESIIRNFPALAIGKAPNVGLTFGKPSVNLHTLHLNRVYRFTDIDPYIVMGGTELKLYLDRELGVGELTPVKMIEIAETMYNRGYSCHDLMTYLESLPDANEPGKIEIQKKYQKIKIEFRNEPLLIFTILESLQQNQQTQQTQQN